MQPIHLWLSVYDRQTKKPKRNIQPILPIIINAYQASLNNAPINQKTITSLTEKSHLHEQYISQLKQWERGGYFTIEERRFGQMVSRIFHLDQKASAAFQSLKEYQDRIDLHIQTNEDLHYQTFSALLNTREQRGQTNHPWAEAASQLISNMKNQ
ncbi:hypothetical protein JMA_01330 [Jeotgalibacillus malaysiensis]|uniref:Uncharacterized protein n=1 Tax=Jeotgalibacillus malaysiensis TaxID=1508404 RepID=A0A0B5AGI0_9BACL|nr:hypothetical protein [Jeotgalibacillus malaysiensis]AJD89450.1 hypothetical protein JMA_01330 [Jeotgalibacillus malaysiensis]